MIRFDGQVNLIDLLFNRLLIDLVEMLICLLHGINGGLEVCVAFFFVKGKKKCRDHEEAKEQKKMFHDNSG